MDNSLNSRPSPGLRAPVYPAREGETAGLQSDHATTGDMTTLQIKIPTKD